MFNPAVFLRVAQGGHNEFDKVVGAIHAEGVEEHLGNHAGDEPLRFFKVGDDFNLNEEGYNFHYVTGDS